MAPECLDGFAAIGCLKDNKALFLETLCQGLAQRALVVNDQDRTGHPDSLLRGWGHGFELLDRPVQPGQRPLVAESHHRVEEWRCGCPAGDGDADCHE